MFTPFYRVTSTSVIWEANFETCGRGLVVMPVGGVEPSPASLLPSTRRESNKYPTLC